jgi:tyrosyl-tRNA synthetase
MAFLKPEEQLRELKKGIVDLVSEEELLEKLKKSYKENKPLRIKAGFDPSRPELHLGHTVLLNKMRQFQQLGHHVIFLIGDFTAMIGDPTGKNETRPTLTEEEVKINAKTYADQVFHVLDPEKTEVAYNNVWMKKFTPRDFIQLAACYNVARMLERDDFEKRYRSGQSISVHEFLYPLVQAYDSVALKSDVELGGSDQRFNLLVGRDIQKAYGLSPQCILTMPLLEGLDGVQKMSKSYDNYIGLEEAPREIFGKTMSLSDEMMVRYYELLTDWSVDQVSELKSDLESGKQHPRNVKVELAKIFVERFHDKEAAEGAEKEFNEIFVKKGIPDDMPEFSMGAGEVRVLALLTDTKLCGSGGEARRLVRGKAVQWDGDKVTDENAQISLVAGKEYILKAGKKRFAKIKVN